MEQPRFISVNLLFKRTIKISSVRVCCYAECSDNTNCYPRKQTIRQSSNWPLEHSTAGSQEVNQSDQSGRQTSLTSQEVNQSDQSGRQTSLTSQEGNQSDQSGRQTSLTSQEGKSVWPVRKVQPVWPVSKQTLKCKLMYLRLISTWQRGPALFNGSSGFKNQPHACARSCHMSWCLLTEIKSKRFSPLSRNFSSVPELHAVNSRAWLGSWLGQQM